jgi:transposase-like protein
MGIRDDNNGKSQAAPEARTHKLKRNVVELARTTGRQTAEVAAEVGVDDATLENRVLRHQEQQHAVVA